MDTNQEIRKHLIGLLRGGQAYDTLEDILADFAADERGVVPPGAERSAWQILDHLTRALVDINEYSDNDDGNYEERNWPDDYWSDDLSGDWNKSIKEYLTARARMEEMIKDPQRDLLKVFAWSDEHTLLREALLAADHQAHHLGQLVELKRWLVASKRG